MATTNNYVLGRGELFFAASPDGGVTYGPEKFFGDCKAVAFAFKSTDLDHYQSTGGVKEIDDSITLQVDRTGSFTTENISPENLALFFLGTSGQVATAGATLTDQIYTVSLGAYTQLGATAANPSGDRDLDPETPVVVADAATDLVIAVAGTDYTIDYSTGRIYWPLTSSLTEGESVKVDYTTLTQTRAQVVSSNTPISGRLRFISNNPTGANQDCVVPFVRISPNGSFDLIGDKWQALQFDMKLIALAAGQPGGEAIYIDGRGHSA